MAGLPNHKNCWAPGYAVPMTAFDPWDPYRDLRFAGMREHPVHGTCA